jgi:hypothetical protein
MKWIFNFFNGSMFTLSFSGGGNSAPAPTTQTVQQSNIPEYARPYFEDIMNRGQAASQVQYQPYTGPRQAGFTEMQNQGFQGVAGLGASPLMQPASQLTGTAGIGGLQAGNSYASQATNPGAIGAYMSPYMQNVVDWQKTQAISDYGRQLPGMNSAATRAGAFGGSRQAIVQAESQRNLQNQLGGIQAQGTQQAFDQANKNLQYGSDLNLRGLGLAGQMGQQFGQLGQMEFGQKSAAAQAQMAAGASQQAQAQTGLDQNYEEFMRQQLYPQSQLQFLSSLLRGSVVSPNQTMYSYQAPTSSMNQLASLGLGAYGTSKLFGAKKGGVVKKFADGGIVGGRSPEQQYQLALKLPMDRLMAIMSGQPGEVDQTSAMMAFALKKKTQVAQDGVNAQAESNEPSVLNKMLTGIEAVPVNNMDIPDGGIAGGAEPVAMAEGGSVPGGVQPFKWEFQSIAERRERERQRQKALKLLASGDYAQNEREMARLGLTRSDEPEQQMSGPTSAQGIAATAPVAAPAPQLKNNTRGKSTTGIAALVPSSGGEPDAAAYGPSSIQGVAPPLSAAAQESEEDMLKRFAEQAGSYTKAERDALRKAEAEAQTKGEKGIAALRDESKGVAALRAAAALVDPKNQNGKFAGIGAAFGAAGETGADYGKQKRAFEKDLEKSRMDAAKADVAFKQGDFELGSKLMSMSQDRKLKAAELAAQTAYREAMVRLQGTQLSEQERHNRAREAAETERNRVLMVTGTARAGGRAGFTDAQKANMRRNAEKDVDALIKSDRALKIAFQKNPALRTQEVNRRLEMYLSGEAAAPTSIQIPDSAAGKGYLDATQ